VLGGSLGLFRPTHYAKGRGPLSMFKSRAP
jgi:hypothetical protein